MSKKNSIDIEEHIEKDEVKSKKSIEKKNIVTAIIVALIVLFIVSINWYYFSGSKVTRLDQSGEQSIIYMSNSYAMQRFVAPYDDITGVIIYCYAEQDDGSSIAINIAGQDGTIVGYREVYAAEILNNSGCYCPIEDTVYKGDTYTIFISGSTDCSLGVYVSDSTKNGFKSQNDQGYTLLYQIEYSPYVNQVLVINLYFLIIALVVIKLFQSKTEKKIIYSTVFGMAALAMFFVIPFNTLYDEHGHFYRSYELSEGKFLSDKNEEGIGVSNLDSNLFWGLSNMTSSMDYNGAELVYAGQRDMFNVDMCGEKLAVENANQALYSIASYIPQTIGLAFARLITDNTYLIYFYGRFFALLINSILVILAINIMPRRKMLVFIIALSPVFLMQMVSYSADGTLNSLALFFVAYIMMLRERDNVRVRDMLILGICSVIIALSKVIYFPFVLLLLLVPAAKFKKKSVSNIFKGTVITVSLVLSAVWFVLAQSYVFDGAGALNTSRNMQLHYALSHFWILPSIVFNTIYVNINEWMHQLVAGAFARGVIPCDRFISLGMLCVLVFEFLTSGRDELENNTFSLGKKSKLGVIAIICMIMALTFGSLYVQWTSYMANVIDGIQGRYFIPLLIPIAMLFKPMPIGGKDSDRRVIAEIMIILFVLLCASLNAIQVYI